MPNRTYLDIDNADFQGVKKMKSKDRVTRMVCISATSEKVPLVMVGTAKQPLCFKFLCPNSKPPMPYIPIKQMIGSQKMSIFTGSI